MCITRKTSRNKQEMNTTKKKQKVENNRRMNWLVPLCWIWYHKKPHILESNILKIPCLKFHFFLLQLFDWLGVKWKQWSWRTISDVLEIHIVRINNLSAIIKYIRLKQKTLIKYHYNVIYIHSRKMPWNITL